MRSRGFAVVNVSCLPEIIGPVIVTLVLSLARVIPEPALRALSDVPTNTCVELAGVYTVSESCFESSASCKVYEVPVASKFISCGAASNHALPAKLIIPESYLRLPETAKLLHVVVPVKVGLARGAFRKLPTYNCKGFAWGSPQNVGTPWPVSGSLGDCRAGGSSPGVSFNSVKFVSQGHGLDLCAWTCG